MTILGLKRVLFPLYEVNRTKPDDASKRQASVCKTTFQGDSLANLGQIIAITNQKIRRSKRQRDRDQPGGRKEGRYKTGVTGALVISLDSLATLGTSSIVPKTVSPASVGCKDKDTKKASTINKSKLKRTVKRAKCSKLKRNKLNQSSGDKASRGSIAGSVTNHQMKVKSSARAEVQKQNLKSQTSCFSDIPTQATGLGAMFGIAYPNNCNAMEIDLQTTRESTTDEVVSKKCAKTKVTDLEVKDAQYEQSLPTHSMGTRSGRKTEAMRSDGSDIPSKVTPAKSSGVTEKREKKKTAKMKSYVSKAPMRRSKRQRDSQISYSTVADKSCAENEKCIPRVVNDTSEQYQKKDIALSAKEEKPSVSTALNVSLRRSKRRRSTDNCTPDTSAVLEVGLDTIQSSGCAQMEPDDQYTPTADDMETKILRSKRDDARLDRPGIFVDSGGSCIPSMVPKAVHLPVRGDRMMIAEASKKLIAKQASMISSSTKNGGSSERWHEHELHLLCKAHQEVDPKSDAFWEDVADHVGTKTSSECRERWFSFVETPAPPARKPKKTAVRKAATGNEDDIFDATPMKAIFHLPETCGHAFDIGNLRALEQFGIGSAIKVSNDACTDLSNNSPLLLAKYGYKTYIKNVKRDMNASASYRLPRMPGAKAKKKNLSFKDVEGDFEVNGRLSPGGTLRVNTDCESGQVEDAAGDDHNLFLSDDEEGSR